MTTSAAAEAVVASAGVLASSAATTSLSHVLREIACAALAAVFTITWLHPIDVVKTRIQIAKSSDGTRGGNEHLSYAALIRSIAASEGRASFYRGITAAWIAEAVYYGLQLGLYAPLKQFFDAAGANDRAATGLTTKLLAGALAGSFGAITGTPFVVVRTRMVANDGPRRGMARFLEDVVRDDGASGFYRGFSAMFVRCIVLSAAKMATYDTVKTLAREKFPLMDGVALQFLSAFVAGFFITGTVMPFDMIRTRMMLPSEDDEAGRTTSFVRCARDVYDQYGPGGFYRGACAFWVRIAPKTCLQLIAFEYLKQSDCFRFKGGNSIAI